MNCHFLQTSEIQVIVGDCSRDGMGGRQYCGLWSLTSKDYQFNAFGNSYGGLIPGELRGKTPVIESASDSSCILFRPADADYPVSCNAVYKLTEPYYVDHSIAICDKRDMRIVGCDFRELTWCSYMNCPEDDRLNFLSNGQWFSYNSPEHGKAANIAPTYIAPSELELFPNKSRFNWDRAECTFDQPFYYGRLGPMALIMVFDCPEWLRFFCSPTGGGNSLLSGKACPAWDFEWVIPAAHYKVNYDYVFQMRLIYKKFISNQDVLNEYKIAKESFKDSTH